MKERKKIICAIVLIIIIAGIIVTFTKGFNKELIYSNRKEIVIVSEKNIDEKEIENIVSEVLTNRYVKVQKVDRFGKAVEITSNEISEDEKGQIITKINEKYEISIENDNVKIVEVPEARVKDVLKLYILPGIITSCIMVLYFAIVYNKLGLQKVLIKSICIPLIIEILYYSIIAILRIPFGRITNSIAIGIYLITIMVLTELFQKEKIKVLENDKKENEE